MDLSKVQCLLAATVFILVAFCGSITYGEYIPPGPLYRCPKEKLLLHPCSCDVESDQGIHVSCSNTNLASMSVALNNLATFRLPIERLLINNCHIARLYGSLLYKLKLRLLFIEDTPIERIDEHTFLGVNNTLNEIHIINSSLREFPTFALKLLGNLTTLNIDGHHLTNLPKDAFAESNLQGVLLRLRLPNGNLTTPPIETFQPLRKLKTLDLHGNQLKELKRNQFKGLRDVEVLDLSYNHITKVDSSHLADLAKMGWFNVSHNSITDITRGAFARNTLLKLLNMSHNKIRRLDANSFRGMRFLRRLFLSDNQIADVGRGTFGSLQRIGTIDLARNFVKRIDYQMFFQLNYVEVLDVSENNVTEIQKLAFKDIYLAAINLSRNNISKIESGAFENCANISKLDLSYNNLQNLPKKAFDETTYATELQFSYNFFTNLNQIPLHNMTGLKILNVSHNQIMSIPKGTFPKLYELHTIDLSHNNLTDIFNSVFQTLFSLRFLDLSHNFMESIKPGTFGALSTVLKLDLSYNRLSNIARSALTRLASAREVSVRGNKLTSLFLLPISTSHLDLAYNEFSEIPPKQWPTMNSLLTLDLSHNNLGDSLVQGSFAGLLTLQKLYLSYNSLTLPPWAALNDLTSLQYLYMQGNNLTSLKRNAFGRLPVVFELNLARNNLNYIAVDAFEGLLQVAVMNLSYNNLSSILNEAFHGLVALHTLDLSYNRLVRLDNKTNSLFEDCLSLTKLNLSHNRINFLSRKMFPANPYIPYRLKEIDLSYNSIPVITFDLTFGTSKLEKLNLSHNAIADIRKGVIGNLSQLISIDLSYNKLHDITTDQEFFRLPINISEIYLSNNELTDLPWPHLRKASALLLLDVRNNLLNRFSKDLTQMVAKQNVAVKFEGNPLHCDCFLRPLNRWFLSQLQLPNFYRNIRCASPSYLNNSSLYQLTEARLNCPINVNTTLLKEEDPGNYEITSDLKYRELMLNKKTKVLTIKWRVTKNADIADTYLFIRDKQTPPQIVFESNIPYFRRNMQVSTTSNLSQLNTNAKDYQLCILARNSLNSVRGFYADQCKNLTETVTSGSESIDNHLSIVTLLFMICLRQLTV